MMDDMDSISTSSSTSHPPQAPQDPPTIDPIAYINEETLSQIQTQLDALESMRRANLDVEFSNFNSSLTFHHDRCTFCQREQFKATEQKRARDAMSVDAAENFNVGIGAKWRELKLDGHRIRSLDGRRIKSFSQRFRSKSAATAATDDNHNDTDDASEAAAAEVTDGADNSTTTANHDTDQDATSKLHQAESCPARLGDQSSSTTKSTESSSTEIKSSRRNILRRTVSSCLTCGHPTCAKHTSNTFSTHHIQICQQCAYLFELEFLVDVIAQASEEVDEPLQNNDDNNNSTSNNNMQQCQRKVNSMIDCYDRAKLLLSYTSQYAPQISQQLQSRTAKSNKIGVGANASGIVSGIAGIVGAGALLCPPVAAAGVPILIASLVFGGGATAAHTADYASVKLFSEPNILADKMMVLHGMCLSLLRVVEVLNFGLLQRHELENNDGNNDESNNGNNNEQEVDKRQALTSDIRTLLDKHGVNTTTGKQSISSTASLTATNIANRSTRYLGRIGTAAAASVRFVPLAGGVLSAASLVVEANEIKATLARMNEGNPCEKSQRILEIAEEVDRLPETCLIAGECRRVFEEAMGRREDGGKMICTTSKVDLSPLTDGAFDDVVAKEMKAADII